MGYQKFRPGHHKKNKEQKKQLSGQKKLPGRPRKLKKKVFVITIDSKQVSLL